MSRKSILLLTLLACCAGLLSAQAAEMPLEDALKALPAYKLGDSRVPLSVIEAACLAAGNDRGGQRRD